MPFQKPSIADIAFTKIKHKQTQLKHQLHKVEPEHLKFLQGEIHGLELALDCLGNSYEEGVTK